MVALAPLAFRFRLRPSHLTHVAAGTIRMSHGFRRMHMSRRALRGSPFWVDIHYHISRSALLAVGPLTPVDGWLGICRSVDA